MYVFAGTHELTLDEKNRVVLPLALRKCIKEDRDKFLEKGFMLTPGDRTEYLELFPTDEYDRYVDKLANRYLPEDKAGQDYLRRLTSMAIPIELDRQFRFILPEKSAASAGISREVFFIGARTRIEIWAKDRWEKWAGDHKDMSIPAPSKA